MLEKTIVELKYCNIKQQLANLFTKGVNKK